MFRKQIKNLNLYIILVGDMALFALAHAAAYFIRFEFRAPEPELNNMLIVLPFIIPIKLLIFKGFGLYQGMWRYASLPDLWQLVKATILSSLIIISAILIIHRFSGFSRAVFILDGGLTFLFVGASRMAIRLAHQKGILGKRKTEDRFIARHKSNGKSVLIIGAGDAGEKTLRELAENPRLPLKVVGFIDDDTTKKKHNIHGIPVLGDVKLLGQLVSARNIEEVLIAIPSATGAQMRRIVDACEAAGVRFRTLPGLGEIIDGKVDIKALRDVDYMDLLGRPAVALREL